MKTNYVLVDFENVQPENLDLLKGGQFKIKMFVGANQKIPVAAANALLAFGNDAEYIQMDGSGKNALDFHIVYYVGRLALESPGAFFHIISKDTGFDPLITHLKQQKILSKRSASVDEIPLVKYCLDSKPLKEQVEIVKERLVRVSRPRTEKTLTSTITSLFSQPPPEEHVAAIIKELQKSAFITITGGKIAYP